MIEQFVPTPKLFLKFNCVLQFLWLYYFTLKSSIHFEFSLIFPDQLIIPKR